MQRSLDHATPRHHAPITSCSSQDAIDTKRLTNQLFFNRTYLSKDTTPLYFCSMGKWLLIRLQAHLLLNRIAPSDAGKMRFPGPVGTIVFRLNPSEQTKVSLDMK